MSGFGIEIISISPVEDRGVLKAFIEVKVGDIVISDCRVIKENGKKPWVSMPVLSYKNEHGTARYKTLIQILDKDLKNEISQAVLRAWESNHGGEDEFRKNS